MFETQAIAELLFVQRLKVEVDLEMDVIKKSRGGDIL
jgi:hypothetical protein